jgi:hypothetical protein
VPGGVVGRRGIGPSRTRHGDGAPPCIVREREVHSTVATSMLPFRTGAATALEDS